MPETGTVKVAYEETTERNDYAFGFSDNQELKKTDEFFYNEWGTPSEKKFDQNSENGIIVKSAEFSTDSAKSTHYQPAVNMPQQETQKSDYTLDSVTVPQINKVEELFNQAMNSDKKELLTIFITWILNNATWEESRQIEIGCKKRKALTKTETLTKKPKSLTLIESDKGKKYICEVITHEKTGRRTTRSLTKRIKNADFSFATYTMSDEVRQFLIASKVALPDSV